MAARPPSTGETEEPDAVAFGIAAVDDHLDRAAIEFPATAREIADATGDPEPALDDAFRDFWTVRLRAL